MDDINKIENKPIKLKKSKLALVAFVLGLLYLISISAYFLNGVGSSDTTESIGAGIASVVVAPHIISTGVAVIFNGLGYFMNKKGFMLVSGILYTVAMVLFPLYFMFVLIQAILSYIAYAKMPKTS